MLVWPEEESQEAIKTEDNILGVAIQSVTLVQFNNKRYVRLCQPVSTGFFIDPIHPIGETDMMVPAMCSRSKKEVSANKRSCCFSPKVYFHRQFILI